jgi:hypothetical protein
MQMPLHGYLGKGCVQNAAKTGIAAKQLVANPVQDAMTLSEESASEHAKP